jgi:hypothetical protein
MCKQEMRKRRLEEMTTRLATLPADAMAVEALEGGFQKFAENMNTVLDRLGVERPQVGRQLAWHAWMRGCVACMDERVRGMHG